MADQHYWNKYQEAVTHTGRIRQQIENLESAIASGFGDPEELEALEEEYNAAKMEEDDLYCLSNFGKTRKELNQARAVKRVGLEPKPHFPETPRGGKLPH